MFSSESYLTRRFSAVGMEEVTGSGKATTLWFVGRQVALKLSSIETIIMIRLGRDM